MRIGARSDHAPAAASVPVDLGGGVSVTAISDAVADHPQRLETCFPGVPAAGWDAVKEMFPGTVGADGRWRLPVTCYLIRTPRSTVLVDAGIGSSQTLASEMFRVVGGLPLRLARLGVSLEAVDAVLFTHLHEDHLGWAVDVATGWLASRTRATSPTGPNGKRTTPGRRPTGWSSRCIRSSAPADSSRSRSVQSTRRSRSSRCRATPPATAGSSSPDPTPA